MQFFVEGHMFHRCEKYNSVDFRYSFCRNLGSVPVYQLSFKSVNGKALVANR
ncbi:hypothetical protein SAMN05192541_1195 [Bradyrhizobium arachidis]|nr:hypothetical protein SAMN05192541_1195 [Bradyrhizobium arachidis]